MHVLVALDDSPTSARAAREAARLFPGAEFSVVNVARMVVPWATADYGAVYPMHLADLPVDGLTDEALAARADAAGLGNGDLLAVSGDPADMICRVADELDADLVVVGSTTRACCAGWWTPRSHTRSSRASIAQCWW